MGQAKRQHSSGRFFSHLRSLYNEANQGHENDALPSKLLNAYNQSVHYPSIIRKAQDAQPLMMRTHAGRRLAIHDALSFVNKKSADAIAEFAEDHMKDELDSAWVRLDPAYAMNDYLDTRKELDHKGKPNDFDRIKKMSSLADYKDHVLFIANIVEKHRYNEDIQYFDFHDIQGEKRNATIAHINTAAQDVKSAGTLKLIID